MTSMEQTPEVSGPRSSFPLEIPPKVKSFTAGAIAGSLAKSSVAPFDRTKIMMQVSSLYKGDWGAEFTSVRRAMHYIYKKDGFWGFFKGNGAVVARVAPYAAIQFTSFEFYHRTLHNLLLQHHETDLASLQQNPSPFLRFFAGSMAGITAVSLTYPLDYIRTHLAVKFSDHRLSTKESLLNKGLRKEILATVSNHGLQGLYRGVYPTLVGIIPYSGTNYLGFGLTKRQFEKRGITNDYPTLSNLACGAISGTFSQTVTFPLDVVRRRVQVGDLVGVDIAHEYNVMRKESSRTSVTRALIHIVKTEGVFALYKGLSLTYIKAVPAIAISFTVYDYLSHAWNIPKSKYSATA